MNEIARQLSEINAKLEQLLQKQQYGAENNPHWLTAAEAAKVLRISRGHVYELVKQGAIPSVAVGRAVRINAAALKATKQ